MSVFCVSKIVGVKVFGTSLSYDTGTKDLE